ncbi:hypothetical protein HOK68_03840 [Candidatus Woesearchaeota archaeon]|jgi:DNA excision repair protein ERCC-4|nr:hypothetical protein [Candidatus Woesearchaeota archaeon]MBT4387892.1 hypothetical protein [Candidatus Woesearchaeota archaeon]MBT4595711.1 hypothetical protein [Candidatus Woesearchaeota archaeon]MBT5741440.1 hypothetical protein [Candidatus Woesearchaeota archaeon]MBT6505881.1 hypothetical protein [Candidatus Woesearchaeota archaeon]
MKLVVDTREQKPYSDKFNTSISFVFKTLSTGDYSIDGYENKFAIERKSKDDFISSITYDRNRFEKEVKRSKNLDFFAVLIDCDFADFANRNYYSQHVTPNQILGTLYAWSIKYNIHFHFVGSRTNGAYVVEKLAYNYLKYRGAESVN